MVPNSAAETRQVTPERGWGGGFGRETAVSLGSDVAAGEGMLYFCQGDFEGWIVVGLAPVPGILVTMETG